MWNRNQRRISSSTSMVMGKTERPGLSMVNAFPRSDGLPCVSVVYLFLLPKADLMKKNSAGRRGMHTRREMPLRLCEVVLTHVPRLRLTGQVDLPKSLQETSGVPPTPLLLQPGGPGTSDPFSPPFTKKFSLSLALRGKHGACSPRPPRGASENSSHTSDTAWAGTGRGNNMLVFCLIFLSFSHCLLLEEVNSKRSKGRVEGRERV